MLAGPAWRAAAEERRTSEAALDLVRVFRRMRSESMAYGRAHILRYTTADSGTFEVYRGTASECNSNLWAPLVAEGPCGDTVAFPNSYCVDGFSMADEAYSIGGTTIQVTAVASKGGTASLNAATDICFEPMGRMMWRAGDSLVSADARMVEGTNGSAMGDTGGGFLFEFQRLEGSTKVGVARYVAIPLGGDARLLR